MKKIIIFSVVVSFLFLDCMKDKVEPENSPEVEIVRTYELGESFSPKDDFCVVEESITYQDSAFMVFTPGSQIHGYAKSIKLNKDWEASAYASVFDEKNYVVFSTFAEFTVGNYRLRETLGIELSSFEVGCYEIRTSVDSELVDGLHASISYRTLDVDVPVTRYIFNENFRKPSFLEINEVNLNEGIIKGKFMFSFEVEDVEDADIWPFYDPEYVRFFNGEFECQII